MLGKGNWASVYLLSRVLTGGDLLSDLEACGNATQGKALKVLGGGNLWEMYVSKVLQNSLPEEAKSSFLKVDIVVAFKDAA